MLVYFCQLKITELKNNMKSGQLMRAMFVAMTVACMTACVSQRDNITYFQNTEQVAESEWAQVRDYAPRLQANDELSIIVSGVDQTTVAAFNKTNYTQSTAGSKTVSTLPNLQTYLVDTEGNISMPVLGEMNVLGMTTLQLQNELKRRIEAYVKDPIVTVNLLSIEVTVLGEVNAPGLCHFSGNRATLLEAIGARGDLTVYGRRDNILLIRETNGKREQHRIDLRDANLINSPYYYLQQNDVIYVSPNESRREGARYSSTKQYNISVISTIVGCVSMLSTLALAIWR